jgi:hypothetical protein
MDLNPKENCFLTTSHFPLIFHGTLVVLIHYGPLWLVTKSLKETLIFTYLSTSLQVHSHINKLSIISEYCHELSEKKCTYTIHFFTQLMARLCICMCVYLYIYNPCGFLMHECTLNVPLSHI